MAYALLHGENAFDGLEPPYSLLAGRRAMSCHGDTIEMVWLVD